MTMSVPLSEPRRPILMVSPSVSTLLGSARMQWSNFSPCSAAHFSSLVRAVDRDAFLVAGDQERDRAFRLAAIRREMVEHGGDAGRDAAFHVDGAAAVERAVDDLAGEGRMRPRRFVAGRHDVGVAGEHQMRRAVADAGVEILHVRRADVRKGHAMHGEAGGAERLLQHGERAAFRRRHRRTAQEIACES